MNGAELEGTSARRGDCVWDDDQHGAEPTLDVGVCEFRD